MKQDKWKIQGSWITGKQIWTQDGNNLICQFEGAMDSYNTTLEDESNINLIASAPDLLSGYKELLGRVNTMAKAMRSNDLGEWVDEWLSDGILSGDTIAKAEGKK